MNTNLFCLCIARFLSVFFFHFLGFFANLLFNNDSGILLSKVEELPG